MFVDFTNAYIPPFTPFTLTVACFSATEHTTVIGANFSNVVSSSTNTTYAFHGGVYKDCRAVINGSGYGKTIYGAWSCDEVNNCKIEITTTGGSTNVYGLYACRKNLYNDITVETGTSIRANGKALLVGNFVNKAVNVDSTVTNIGTVVTS